LDYAVVATVSAESDIAVPQCAKTLKRFGFPVNRAVISMRQLVQVPKEEHAFRVLGGFRSWDWPFVFLLLWVRHVHFCVRSAKP
jgi:hypothetical protein